MDLVFEIGCEELPASFQKPAVEFLSAQLASALTEARLAPQSLALETFATPRRLALVARGLLARAPDAKKTVQGPPAESAFGADGKPTKAGGGFARKLGVAVGALGAGGDRVVVEQELKGGTALEALPAILEKLIQSIPFRKAMRWGDGDATFARPVHWGRPPPTA